MDVSPILDKLKQGGRIIVHQSNPMTVENLKKLMPDASDEQIKQATTKRPAIVWLYLEGEDIKDISLEQFDTMKKLDLVENDPNAGDPENVYKVKNNE